MNYEENAKRLLGAVPLLQSDAQQGTLRFTIHIKKTYVI